MATKLSGESASRRVVFAGVAAFDAIAMVPRLPGPDERLVADEVSFSGGGPAATAAVAAARLGAQAAFVGSVGDDEHGEKIIAGLRQENVDVTGIAVIPGQRSAASVVIVDAERGTRAICTRPGPAIALITDGSAVADLLNAADWVHVDHHGWPAITELVDPMDESRPRLSVDAGNPIPCFQPKCVDLYVPTLQALSLRYGPLSPAGLIDAAVADGARTVVATHGAEGCLAGTANGRRLRSPAYHAEIVSTLGAGDVFHGALLAATIRGLSLADSLAFANTASALSCAALDGRSAIPTKAQLAAVLSANHAKKESN